MRLGDSDFKSRTYFIRSKVIQDPFQRSLGPTLSTAFHPELVQARMRYERLINPSPTQELNLHPLQWSLK